jgi:rare lipoprotein A
MKKILMPGVVAAFALMLIQSNALGSAGVASWYGESHRGRLMANGKKFDPDKLTAASWFYPLGTKVKVTLHVPSAPPRSVVVTVTDRGPAKDLVREGRIIDLGHAAFKRLGDPDTGLVPVTVVPVKRTRRNA